MNVARLVEAKRSGYTHTPDEIKFLIHDYSHGEVSDSEMTAWMKTVYTYGMSDEETLALVDAMITSGEMMDFSHLPNFVADKHSTGGVGDKVSLILGPLMAEAGLAIPMISGRSLGHTGGTLDKLESIPGFRTDLSIDEFRNMVERVGISMIGQTDEICPADKKMYALRDAIGITKSIPFICGSIMSKKIAEGIQGLVLDIKVGNGAFMKTVAEARELGEKLVMVGRQFGISVEVIFSDMNQPLGFDAGLWIEIQESILALQGEGPEDLMEVTFELGGSLLKQAGMASTKEEARDIQTSLIQNGSAFQKFVEMVEAHHGDSSSLKNPNDYSKATYVSNVNADRTGFISAMDTLEIGRIVNSLTIVKSGRNRELDIAGGIRFEKKLGNEVRPGDTLAVCSGGDQKRVEEAVLRLSSAIRIGEKPIVPPKLLQP